MNYDIVIHGFIKELSEIDQDKQFEKYHKINQEIDYYNDELIKAIDEYHILIVKKQGSIEASLIKPLVQELNEVKNKINYEKEKDNLINEFKKNMKNLESKYNNAVLKYIQSLYPELEMLESYFDGKTFKDYQLMMVTTPHFHYRRPLSEYIKSVSKSN